MNKKTTGKAMGKAGAVPLAALALLLALPAFGTQAQDDLRIGLRPIPEQDDLRIGLRPIPENEELIAPSYARDAYDHTPLTRAAADRDPLFPPADGLDAELLEAAGAGDTERVRELLAAGASVHARDDRWDTALHRSARNGHEHIWDLLTEAGADIAAQNRNEQTPFNLLQNWYDFRMRDSLTERSR